MPSLRKKNKQAINKKKLFVKVAPSRMKSLRIKTNAEIKQEPEDEDDTSPATSFLSQKKINQKKATVKPKGKCMFRIS